MPGTAHAREGECHVRYALRIGPDVPGADWIGHSGGCKGTPVVPFKGARIWVNKWDAERYVKHQNVAGVRKRLVVAEITCAVGKPYAVMTEI